MRKKAIIIANQDPLLPGIAKDISHIETFLMSIEGGAWNSSEIETYINPSKQSLALKLAVHKLSCYDYIMVFFTGHGGHKRNETYVQINNDGELISQASLERLCARQMNIYDCCRSEIIDLNESVLTRDSLNKFSVISKLNKEEARIIFERKISQAKLQQLTLYSCSLNEYSQDTKDGALYLTNLLRDAVQFNNASYFNGKFKFAVESHFFAKQQVIARNPDTENLQTPTYSCNATLSIDDQLILSINPEKSKHWY